MIKKELRIRYRYQAWKLGWGLPTGLLLAITILCAASNNPTLRKLEQLAETTSHVEKPAKAAQIIHHAALDGRERFAIRVTRLFLRGAPALAPSLVGAIADQCPEVAVAVTSEAVQLFPEHAFSIVRAAVSSVPEQAAEIALRTSVEMVDKAKEIFAAAIVSRPETAAALLSILEDPALLRRTETQSNLVSKKRKRQVHSGKGQQRPKQSSKKQKNSKSKGGGSGGSKGGSSGGSKGGGSDGSKGGSSGGSPSFPGPELNPEDLPYSDSIEINQNSRGVWIIEIAVQKGRLGNQIVKELRRALRELIADPRLLKKYRIVVERYTN
jgi:uncharacterized membrane protein YgcG